MLTERKINPSFIGAILIAAALIIFFFHTRPTQKTLSDLSQKAAALDQEIAAIESKQAGSASGILSEVDEQQLALAVPQTMDQDRLISDINRMATASEVNFTSLTFSVQTQGAVPTLTLAAGFQGSYQNISRFLKALELNPRKIVIKDASLARSKIEGGAELVNLNISLESYFQT